MANRAIASLSSRSVFALIRRLPLAHAPGRMFGSRRWKGAEA